MKNAIIEQLETITEDNSARGKAVREKIETFENQLNHLREQLTQEREDEKENGQLRRALELVKQKLLEQNEVLEQLTSVPLVHAVVLYIDTMEPAPSPSKFSASDLKDGAIVRVLAKGHSFEGKNGKIVKELDSDGDVKVLVDGQNEYVQAVDNHQSRVKPLDGPADNPDSYAEGKKVEALSGGYEGKTGTITKSNISDNGKVLVDFGDDDEEWLYARKIFGLPLEIISTGTRIMSVVVSYEGKQIELRYPEELIQQIVTNNYSKVAGVNGAHDFPVGSRVRIRKDSEYSKQNDGEGTVLDQVSPGWVKVDFDDGYSNNYRTGDPPQQGGGIDLEFVVPPVMEENTEEYEFDPVYPLKPGDIVKLSMETMQIVEVVVQPKVSGDISIVRSVLNENTIEIEYQGSTKAVHKSNGKIETGDRVILDPTASVILKNLGKEEDRFSFNTETNISWDDIGGLHEAKRDMIEAIELPFRHPEIYSFYNKKPIKGVLLHGCPGCGKTMLGKAAATALAKIHNGHSVSSGFIYIKGPEILDRYVGSAETAIRQIFQRSRKHKEEHGYPAVIFIDEADAIMGKRGMGISSDIERTIVPMFLAEMDGLEDSGAVILLATNRPDILDPAIVRDGRIDRKIKVGRPDIDSTRDIFRLYFKNVPFFDGHSLDDMAEMSTEELFIGNYDLYNIHLNGDRRGQVIKFSLRNLCSGAMITGIVDQATSIAMRHGLENDTMQGVSKENVVEAISCVYRQNIDLNHSDDIAEFTRDFHDDISNIEKLKVGMA